MAKVLVLNGSDPWTQTSGYFLYSARCMELLSPSHSIRVVSLYHPRPDRLPVPAGINRTWYTERRLNARIQRLRSILSGKSFCELEFNYPGVVGWARMTIEQERPDLVIFNHIRAAWLAPLLGRINRPSLYIAHNAEGISYASIAQLESNPVGKLFAQMEGKKLQHLESQILHVVDSVIAVTEEDRNRLQVFRPSLPIHVVPPNFDVQDEAEDEQRPCTILIVGSFHWRPKRTNVLWFLREVYRPLRLARPEIRCVIVGANASALRSEIPALEGIELHADVPSVAPYLRQAAIFVTPERQWGGVKLKTCEAAAYGHPIVSTTPGMEGTGLRDGESCLVANTAGEFMKALLRCLDDPGFAIKIGQQARLEAQARFSQEAVARKLHHAIDAALNPTTS